MTLDIRPTPPAEVAAAIAAAVQALQGEPGVVEATGPSPWRRRAALEAVGAGRIASEPGSAWRAALVRSV